LTLVGVAEYRGASCHDPLKDETQVRKASYVIDESGNPEEVATFLPNDALAQVRELGHVTYSAGHGYLRIRLRPSLTSIASYARLLQWLDRTSSVRIQLSYFVDGRWHDEIAGNSSRAALRIEELVAEFGGGPYGNVRRRPCRLEELTLPRSYETAIRYWQLYRSQFDPVAGIPVLSSILSERCAYFEQNGAQSYVVRGCGNGLAEYARKWLQNANGQSMHYAPDASYGQSCLQAYRETQNAGEPRIDDVDALVKWTGSGRARNRYRRLMLPFRAREQRWMITASLPEPGIELLA